MTEPAAGASVWASGSQVCTGHIGIFTAKEAKKPIQSHFCIDAPNFVPSSATMSVVPAVQYIAMMALWEKDGVTVSALGERLFLDSGTLTPLLKRLEAAKLVRRTRNEADERQVLISLTERGRALKKAAASIPAQAACAAGLPIEELANIKKKLEKLRSNLVG